MELENQKQQPMTRTDAPMERSKLENYGSLRGATAYRSDYENKLHRRVSDRRERRLLERYLAEIGRCDSILDLPCGFGRLAGLLDRHCDRLLEADWSRSMVGINRGEHGTERRYYLRCSGLEIPLPDRSIDVLVSIRLSHHLREPGHREKHLRELFRVAGGHVIVTWFSHTSLKNLLRRARAPFNKKPPKNTLRNERVAEIARECGFEQRQAQPLFRFGSGHVLGWFARRER